MRTQIAKVKRLAATSVLSFAAVMLMAAPVSAGSSNQSNKSNSNKKSHTTVVHKSYVCKYVDKPGVNERLQGGGNPIWVDNHSLKGSPDTVYVGQEFKDAQGKSVVIVANTAKLTPEPSADKCPTPENPETPCPPAPAPTKPENPKKDKKDCPPKQEKPVEPPKKDKDCDKPAPTPAPTEEDKTPTPPVGRGGGEVLSTHTDVPSAQKPTVLANTGTDLFGPTTSAVAILAAAAGTMYFRRRKLLAIESEAIDFSAAL